MWSSHMPISSALTYCVSMAYFLQLMNQKNIYFCFNEYAKVFVWVTTNCGKFLKRWEYQTPYLPPEKPVCRSRINSQNQTGNNGLVSNWQRSMSGCILSPCLFSLHAEYIMWNAGLDEAQAGVKVAGKNINNLRYADDTTLWQKVKN